MIIFFFFFSSRRRHTRCGRDWSSDVCSSDLEVVANDPNDAKSIEAIRAHLREIAKAFAKGDFSKPKAIHEELPDGAAEMRELRAASSTTTRRRSAADACASPRATP